jgi:hypothetical protein
MNEDWFHMVKRTRNLLALAAVAFWMAAGQLAPAAEKGNTETAAPAAKNGAAQRRAAEEYLAALASGDVKAMAQAIHEDELEQLRKRLLDEMKLEADRNSSLVRSRLFGLGMPLVDIERLTPANMLVALAPRLRFSGRDFERVDWLDAVGDSGGMVQMVGKLIPRKDRGTVRVPVVVSIIPWGKDWKAALPLELQAQIDDLRTGRVSARGAPAAVPAATPAATAAPSATETVAPPAPKASALPPGMLELFDNAEKNLKAMHCDDYYKDQMSPNWRRTTGAKARAALVKTCESRENWREQMITAVQLARAGTPRYEYQGTRAVFDLSGQGLPYPALVLEQIDNKHWYIAE